MANKITRPELTEYRNNKKSIREYTNGEITVFWNAELCIHSANCLIGLPDVFDNQKRPWVNIHGSDSKEIMKVVDTCPSRALTYLKSNRFAPTKPRQQVKKKAKFARIQILKDGPLLVSGNFLIRDPQKKKVRVENKLAALCRCGSTRKRPFCDGSHHKAGFKD
jgi:uncharacterized Fe-S cluster protein YjdI